MGEGGMALMPYVRIGLRYGVGMVFGMEVGDILAGDPDVVAAVALALALIIERAYAIAKRDGGPT